jgi:hypothetical protein
VDDAGVTDADIPWGKAAASSRDRSLTARVERALEADADELEPASPHLAAVLGWLAADGDHANVREILPDVALLDVLTYDEHRAAIAKAAGIRASTLDTAVDEARQKDHAEPADELPEPKHETLTATLDATRGFISRFMALSDDRQSVAAALWVAHTHIYEQFDSTPYLHITSPLPECGKSRLLEVLEPLAARPWRAISPSEAVLYRKVERDKPTLFLDEVDPIFGPRASTNAEPLRALLNAGNRRGATVPRCAGEGRNIELIDFNVFCPKALAGIGDLPDTLASRSVRIELRRKTKREPVEKFRPRDVEPEAAPIRDSLAGHLRRLDLSKARPAIPDELGDRAADGWEPLLAIADVSGGDWPMLARDAAKVLSAPRQPDGEALAVRLLADIKAVFDQQGRMFTRDLLTGLHEIDEAPWADFGKGSKGLNSHGLARLLRGFEVRSRDVRIGTEGPRKGYLRDDFEGPWERYTSAPDPENGPSVRDTATTGATNGFAGDQLRDTEESCSASKRYSDNACSGVDSAETRANTGLSRCSGVGLEFRGGGGNIADDDSDGTPDLGDVPGRDPGRFDGMDWREQHATRLREIRQRGDDPEVDL